ncbi:MAG TPA: SRPBCC domain-containing protein [Sphingobacteriaceae bacterium]
MMEQKTKISAEPDRQEILITREFDLPVELVFKAYEDAELLAQWMGTRVLRLESRKHGSYQFETTDPRGNKHRFSGTIHEFEPNRRITRTFEMENTSFPVQLEYLVFEGAGPEKSSLMIHTIYKSVADRDNMLKLPFAQGLNMAHNRIQEMMNNLIKPDVKA